MHLRLCGSVSYSVSIHVRLTRSRVGKLLPDRIFDEPAGCLAAWYYAGSPDPFVQKMFGLDTGNILNIYSNYLRLTRTSLFDENINATPLYSRCHFPCSVLSFNNNTKHLVNRSSTGSPTVQSDCLFTTVSTGTCVVWTNDTSNCSITQTEMVIRLIVNLAFQDRPCEMNGIK